MDATVFPDCCPMPGITFESNGRVDLAGSSFLIGVDSFRVVEVVSIDCFPGSTLDPDGRSVLSAELVFTPSERAKIDKAIAACESLAVTIPEPHVISRNWMTDLTGPAPKPGHIWVDSAETVSDVLTSGLVSRVSRRRDTPPYPTDSYRSDGETHSTRPAERPSPGMTLQIKPEQLRSEGHADRWRVTTQAGHELVVSLLDCYVWDDRYEEVCQVLEAATTQAMAITLPPPIDSIDWIGSLIPGTLHAGYIWVSEQLTLNQLLVDRGIGSPIPF